MPSSGRSTAKTVLFVSVLSTCGTIALLLSAEIAVRIRWAIQHRDPAYLVMGIVRVEERTTPREVHVAPIAQAPAAVQGSPTPGRVVQEPSNVQAPVAVRQPTTSGAFTQRKSSEPAPAASPVNITVANGLTQWNPCTQRDITYHLNSANGRGPEWAATKPAGSVRILAIGESSTFGSANAEDSTWPALLEKDLVTGHGLNAEVLNFGVPGQTILGMIKTVPKVLAKYHPDVVVHYAGFNETWTGAKIPEFLAFLNYRSMLYTYIYEKAFFRAEASALRLLPDTRTYEKNFRALVTLARDHGASLVVVEQAVAGGASRREGAACAESWADDGTLRTCLNDLMSKPDDRYSRLERSRMYKTVVLQRVLADVAAREHLLVVDPRSSLVEGDSSRHLFCDEIHLTDEGNAVLAQALAQPLAEYLRTQVVGRSGT